MIPNHWRGNRSIFANARARTERQALPIENASGLATLY